MLTAMTQGGRRDSSGHRPAFDFLKELGEGPLGSVWLARSGSGPDTGRLVTVRRLQKTAFSSDEIRAIEEVSSRSSALVHPTLAKVLGTEQSGSELFIVGEYVDGVYVETLRRMAEDRDAPLPTKVAVRIVHDMVRAALVAREQLAFRGYRLLFSEGAFVASFGETLLTEVGVLGELALTPAVREHPAFAGQLAPEEEEVGYCDERAEVFAAGVLLWELLANRRLFTVEKRSPMQSMVPDLAAVDRAGVCIGDDLRQIVFRATARRAEDRFASLRLLLGQLRDLAADQVAEDRQVGRALADLAGPFLAACQRSTRVAEVESLEPAVVPRLLLAGSGNDAGSGAFTAREGPTLPTCKLLEPEDLAWPRQNQGESQGLVLAASMGAPDLLPGDELAASDAPIGLGPSRRARWVRRALAGAALAVVTLGAAYWVGRPGARVTAAVESPASPPAEETSPQLPPTGQAAARSRPSAPFAVDVGSPRPVLEAEPTPSPSSARRASEAKVLSPPPSEKQDEPPAPASSSTFPRAYRPRGITPYRPRGI